MTFKKAEDKIEAYVFLRRSQTGVGGGLRHGGGNSGGGA